MTNNSVRFHALLSIFGYGLSQDALPWVAPDGSEHWTNDQVLINLLSDKSQTGAKMELLHYVCGSVIKVTSGVNNNYGETFVCYPEYGVYAKESLWAPTVDEAVNRLLLCVHDLDDPRGDT